MRKIKKSTLYNVVIAECLLLAAMSGYMLFNSLSSIYSARKTIEHVHQVVDEASEDKVFTKEAYANLKAINGDLVGYLVWDSGLIEEPVVQTDNNEYYLRRDFNQNYNSSGVIWMDFKNTLENMNLTLYGHTNDTDSSIKFSKLNDFVGNDKFYNENKTFKLYTEDDVRSYEIMYVYEFNDVDFESYDFTTPGFEVEEDFNNFIQYAVDKTTVSPSGSRIKFGDKMITLQTCKKFDNSKKIIVVAKEVGRTDYE